FDAPEPRRIPELDPLVQDAALASLGACDDTLDRLRREPPAARRYPESTRCRPFCRRDESLFGRPGGKRFRVAESLAFLEDHSAAAKPPYRSASFSPPFPRCNWPRYADRSPDSTPHNSRH